MTKSILILAIAAAFVAGIFATADQAFAPKPTPPATDLVCTGCVDSTDIANGAVTLNTLGSDVPKNIVTHAYFGDAIILPGATSDLVVQCPSNMIATGGSGSTIGSTDVSVLLDNPWNTITNGPAEGGTTPNAWHMQAHNFSPSITERIGVTVVCATLTP